MQQWIQKGATITNDGREYVVLELVDVAKIMARDVETGTPVLLNLAQIGGAPREIRQDSSTPKAEIDLLDVSDAQWEVAKRRRKWIDPLLSSYSTYAQDLAEQIASEAGVSRATVYRWVTDFRNTGHLSSLLEKTSLRGGKNVPRIAPAVEAIIKEVIENFHDTNQKPTIAETVVEIRRLCFNAKLPLPAINTVRTRLARTAGRDRTRHREGEAAAYAKHDPSLGSISDSDWPLAIVMIDHTLLPVIIVDDVHRKPINRAWITLTIDVFSRICLGMYLSLDGPSAMSAGMCITNSIIPKETWLRRLGITNVEWSCWGVMGILHADNAREFRGDMLQAACLEYDIDLHLRPVKKPRYGAHIERLMGTVSQGLKRVGGATFSGPTEKGEYDAEGNAIMTFSELEKWMVLFFARYHNQKHDGIGMTPLQKWSEGILGTKKTPGRGLPARRNDEEMLRIHFMPFIERTIQDYGVVIDYVHYYSDALRPWINAPDPKHPKLARKFRFRRDPRDISQLYFFDELKGRFTAIPYRDTSLPPVSIWELRVAQDVAQSRGLPADNEQLVFSIINEQRSLEEDAAAKTKKARRAQQRRKEHTKQKTAKKETMPSFSPKSPSDIGSDAGWGYNPDDIQFFED